MRVREGAQAGAGRNAGAGRAGGRDAGFGCHIRENLGLGAGELGDEAGVEPAIGMGRWEIGEVGQPGVQEREHQTHDHQRGREAGLVSC